MLFLLGQVVATPGALDALACAGQPPRDLLKRHANGDWGELSGFDAAENAVALKEGYRLLSAYTLRSGERVWVITEADRSVTTILLPEEY